MFLLLLTVVLSPVDGVVSRNSTLKNREEIVRNTTQLLDKLLQGYDKRLRPGFGGDYRLFNEGLSVFISFTFFFLIFISFSLLFKKENNEKERK